MTTISKMYKLNIKIIRIKKIGGAIGSKLEPAYPLLQAIRLCL